VIALVFYILTTFYYYQNRLLMDGETHFIARILMFIRAVLARRINPSFLMRWCGKGLLLENIYI